MPPSLSSGWVAFTSVITTTTLCGLMYWHHNKVVKRLTELRQAERKGRIRAQVRLRSTVKQQQSSQNDNESSALLLLKQIGTVTTPFTKRMGTPRQGALVPSSRGYIEFTIPQQSLEGIDQYSHVWVLFGFHANTNLTNNKSKVKPPRAPTKVGQLATRSPHRPNPIGLSLVKVERLEKNVLHISALDLVNGTPVYDVKPVVPWDVPGHYNGVPLTVPSWVDQDDEKSRVDFAQEAKGHLQQYLEDSETTRLYTRNDFEAAKRTIQEVLAQDPRGNVQRGSTSKNQSYKLLFCHAQVEFVVPSPEVVVVKAIRPIDTSEMEMADGIPLLYKQ